MLPKRVPAHKPYQKMCFVYYQTMNKMQSNTEQPSDWWVVQEPNQTTFKNNYMGWSTVDNRDEVNPKQFASLDEAARYCLQRGFSFYVEKPNLRKPDRKSYADNFRYQHPDSFHQAGLKAARK